MASKKYQELLGQAYRTTGGQGAVFSHDEQGNTYVDQYVGNGQRERVAYTPPTWEEGDTALHWRDEDDDGQQHSSKYLELMDAARELTGGTGTAFNPTAEDDDLLKQTAKEAAEAEAKRKEEAEGYKKKGVLGRIWDVIRGIDTRAGNAFLSNVSGAAASIAGKDTLVSDVQAAAKLIADKDDGVSVGQALKRLDQQAGNRVVATAASAADRIWDSIGGVINRFGGNVDTENDIFSRWNQNRQAIKAASTEALYGPDGVQGNAVSDWNERRVAIQQQTDEMYQNRYSESPVAQAVSKYGTMAWSQAPSAMLAVMMTVANPAAGGEMIANGLAPATTKGLGYIAALENSSGMKKLAMLAGNTVGNLAKDPQFWYSYSQEAGGAYNEAIQEGADPSTASLYASVYGALSGAIEIQGVFEGGNLEKLPGNIKKALMSGDKGRAAWMYVESILGEIGEEEAQDMVSKLLKTTYRDDIPLYSTTDENAVINPRSMLETAKDTAITTALMGAGERAIMGTAQKVSDSRTYRGDAALLFEQAKQAGGEKNAEAIAKIEKAATNAGGAVSLNMGQARELYQIIRDNGGEEAYNEAAKTKNRQQIVGAAVDAAFDGMNLDTKGRETLVNDFTPGETKLSEYIQGVKEAYSLGQKNTTLTQATQSAKRAGVLTAEQFRHAWQLGRGEVTTETNTADTKTEEGKTRLTSELKVMGEHAEAAAAVYNADQDVSRFAAAMNTAANLYAAQGDKIKDFVADVREGKAASEIGYLTDEQLTTAYQIGTALKQEQQAAVKASAAKFETIRAQAQKITAQAASAAQIDKAITETRAYIQNETKQADELKAQADELISADEVPENAEEIWNRATAEEKEHRKNAEKAQETLKELETKRKEIPATESAETRGRATLASEGGNIGGMKYEAVNEAELTRQQRTITEAVGLIAEELGLDVTIVKAKGNVGGAYIGGGRIYLNIYSGMNLQGFSKAIAAGSFSHEMTHWLQEYASEEYDELKQYIRDSMGSEKYDALVKQEQRAQPGLSYEQAENEVVANACQPMLQNSKAFEQFAREHRSVAEKIRDFLKEFLDKIKAAFAEVDFQDNIPIYNAVKAVENELEGMQEIFDRALVRARENLQAERTVSNQTENRQETVSEQAESAAQLQSWDDMTEDEQRAEINAAMTMEQARTMVQKAFVAGGIKEWHDGEYRNGDEWLRAQGADEVAMYIENEYELQRKYINSNEHINNEDYTIIDVLEAYLAGTLTGKVKKATPRVDTSRSRGVKDRRFYAPKEITVTPETWDLANSRATKKNQAEVTQARKGILFAAHSGDITEALGITATELNKKLRTWSRYSANARETSMRINAGVAPENQWTGIQNSSILNGATITDEDIRSMVKEIAGESSEYQRGFIGNAMLALDTHINWSWLSFDFKKGAADESRRSVRGLYNDSTRKVTVGGSSIQNTVSHEMGHALDYQWERELFGDTVAGRANSTPLSQNFWREDLIKDEEGRIFYRNFRSFIDELMDVSSNYSSYTMEPTEVFARFVAKFVEWTQETAGAYTWKDSYLTYDDKFSTKNYYDFARLLQEKAALDTKRAAENGVQFQSWNMEEYEEYTGGLTEEEIYDIMRGKREEQRSIQAQIKERKPEEGAWIDRVVKGETTAEEYAKWAKSSGMDDLYNQQREIEKELQMLSKRYDELVDERMENEQRKAIEKSGLSEGEYFGKQAVKEFGYTPYFYDAGYIVPNGKMLNFSGEKGRHFGSRGQDHRAISTIFATTTGSDAMNRFISYGNIRIMAEAPGLDISAEHEPTPEQYRQIKSFVRESMDEGYFAVDFTAEGGRNIGSLEYDDDSRISADRVMRDIKQYFQTGKVPETQRYQFQSWGVEETEQQARHREIREEIEYGERARVSEETIDRWLKDYAASNPQYAQAYIAYMEPFDFLRMTTSGIVSREQIKEQAKGLTVKDALDFSKGQPIQLIIDSETGKVRGHEGRHRMVALKNSGIRRVPVLLFDSSNKYSKVPIDTLTLEGQDFQRVNTATSQVRNIQPLSTGNRDAVVEQFSKPTSIEKLNEKYSTRQYAVFQRWDVTEGDTAAESNGRNLAYTRLQSENKILKDTVKALNKLTGKQSTTIEKLQERLRLNKTPEVREDDAKKMARSLLREYGSKADSEAIARQLKEMGDYILQTSTEKVSEEEIKRRARAVAAEIIDAASEQISVDGEYMAEIVGSIRGKKLTIDDAFLGELDQAGGFETFRRRNFGKFTLAKRGGSYDASQYMSVSQFYTDLQNNYGKSYFPDAANEGEEIIRIADAFDLARPMEVNPFEQYMGEAVEDLANRIAMDTMGGILRAEPARYADVEYRKEKSRNEELNERIKKLESENALSHEEAGRLWNQVSDLTTKLDLAETQYAALQKAAEARLEQVRAEGRERETEIKAREREKAARDMKALKDYYRRKAKSQKEMRENAARSTKYRAEIERKTKKLRDMLVTNSDKLHVPEVLKAPLGDFLAGIDMSSKSLLNYDIATQKDQKFHASFARLLNALSGQQEYFSGTGEVQADMGGYIDISSDNMEFLRRMTEVVAGWMDTGETYTINRMNTQQLQDLSNLLTNLTQAIQNLNNFMANERYATVGEAARGDITRMEELGRASEGENSRLYTATAWENGTPYYIFKRLGEGAKTIFDGLTRGWEKMAFNVQEVIGFTEGLYSTEEVNKWKAEQHEITLEDGHKVTMTTAQIMEFSMLLEREQALKHIEHGGIRVGDIETRRGRKHDTRHYHLTAGDIAKITGLLSERQLFVAKALRNYMASKGSEWGNEISMRRFGYKFYTEGEGYYPIKTDANDRPMADTDAQTNSMFRLLNLSSSKTLNPRASNALIVGDIFETFSDHMADMAKLNGLGLPLLDAIKYFNYKERIDRGDGTYDTVTVQGAMEQAFGSAAQRYYRTLIKDVNGVTENGDRGTAIYNKFMSNYKAAAVAANLRVAFLQPTSYVRASFIIKPQYLAGVLPSKAAYAEAKKWSGTVNWKEIGGVDTNLARGMRDQIERDSGWKENLVEKSMILAELGDKITWSRLWTACKRQTKAENRSLTGDELNRATADLFREVIYGTQVMDSTLTRSELMRGRSNATKAMTAFMAEPTLSYNLLFDAVYGAHYDVRRHGKSGAWSRNVGKIGKAATVYVCSAAWSAVVESIFDAMRDDDDFESFMEKWAQAMFGEGGKWWTGNLAQDLTILGKLPFFKNFISTFQGYKSGDMSITAFNTAVDAVKIWDETYKLNAGILEKATKVTYYGNMTTWGKVYKTLQALSQLSGIGVANLTRDATALWNSAMSLANHEEKKIKTYETTAARKRREGYAQHVAQSGLSQTQYNTMYMEADADGDGIEQAEIGPVLMQKLESGEITQEQADAIWSVQGWKTSFDKWRDKNGSTASEPESTPEPTQNLPMNGARAEVPAERSGMSYEDFKNKVPLYSDKRATTYRAWEANLKPAGITLEQFSDFLIRANTDGNSSLKQDELGTALRGAVTNGEMTADQAVAVWNAQGWKTSLATWASKH